VSEGAQKLTNNGVMEESKDDNACREA